MAEAAERPGPSDQEVDAIVCQVLDLPADRRTDYLERACGDDPRLLERVASLIAAGEATDPLLRPGGAAAPGLMEELGGPAPVFPGSRLGRYRVLREIGRGGMGVVYLAERADGHFDQQVALKILPPGADAAALDRFARERQILADLEHPNIARLIDGGVAAGGQPYLVMDFVAGVAIDRHCREQRVGLRRRVELLIEVCSAVEAAHRRLIVHRDLKPSNILVTREGQVKLLDFGIAKLIREDRGGGTVTAARFLTPQYASPEQIRGETISVASDVYQIGLLAFELLTGRRPYDLGNGSAVEAARKICRQEPSRPSAVGPPEEDPLTGGYRPRPRDLEGDLDTIVLKTLRKEPERRYASVAHLREDLERHLSGFPVSARPDTWSYRLGKLIRRNTLAVAAASTAALLLVGSAGAFTWSLARERDQTRRAAQLAEQQRLRAEQRRAETEEVVDFLVGLFEASDPYASDVASTDLSARDLLRWGAEKLETTFADRPLIRARLMHTTGRIYSRMELFDEAEPLLRGALALREAASQDPRAQDQHAQDQRAQDQRLEIAELENDLGLHYTAARREEEAETALRRALDLRREVLGDQHELVAATSVALATLLHRQGRYDESEALLAEAVATYDGLTQPGPEQHVAALLRFGQSRLERGHLAEARQLFEHALAVGRGHESPDGPLVAAALKSIARCAVEQGELEASLPLFHQSLEIYERRFGAKSIQASNVRQNLAYTLYGLGEVEEAFRLFRKALITVEGTLGEHSFDALALRFNLAGMRLEQADPAGAEADLRRLQPLLREHLGPSHKLTLLNDLTLGQALTRLERYREAEVLVRSSLDQLEKTFGPEGQFVSLALLSLARIHRHQGEPTLAEPLLRRALDIRRSTMQPTAPEIQEIETELAEVVRDLDDLHQGQRKNMGDPSVGGSSPDALDPEGGQISIAGDQGQTLEEALGRKHAVEGVAVRHVPAPGALSVEHADGQLFETSPAKPSG